MNSDISESEIESTKIEIYISCRQLSNYDLISLTDSFVLVKLKEFDKPEKQILRTAVRWNDLQPDYPEILTVQYFFETKQQLEFQVYHEANPPVLIGSLKTSIGQIFGSPNKGLIRPIINPDKKQTGKIILRCDLVEETQDKQVQMQISAIDLPKKSFFCFFCGTNLFFKVYSKREKKQLLVYQSEQQPDSSHCIFKKCNIPIRRLCGKSQNHPFNIRFYSYARVGSQIVGEATFSLADLHQGAQGVIKNQDNESIGTCCIEKINMTNLYKFQDFIKAGLQLALVIAIDFTQSNLQPEDPNSLHCQDLQKNQYVQALKDVTSILLDYDSDKLVPMYGFGAKVQMPNFSSNKKSHHCFPINGDEKNPNVYELQGVIQAYKKCLPYLKFQQPTFFKKVLQQCMDQCKKFQKKNNQYMILLILTDGQIDDKPEVIQLLIASCTLPLSIIIVGVGEQNFEKMVILDDDKCELTNKNGQKTSRDLVQFVPFNKFNKSSSMLATQVLYELPRQVSQYFALMNLDPSSINKKQTKLYNNLAKKTQQDEF